MTSNSCNSNSQTTDGYVQQHDGRLWLDGQPYRYVGTNFWYGPVLGSEGQGGDRQRLLRELDSLHRMGVDNLRILVGADGNGTERYRLSPCLQQSPGQYDDQLLAGLDYLLWQMAERGMKAVLYLNNSWGWSGGYTFYLEHVGLGAGPDQNDDGYQPYISHAALFSKSTEAQALFLDHVRNIVGRTNRYTHRPYTDDTAIMAWQIGNEPRAFCDSLKQQFAAWLAQTSALIRSIDSHHLISIGSEGIWGCDGDEELHRQICSDPNIDYVTAHIWPVNWSWATPDSLMEKMPVVLANTTDYIDRHTALCRQLGKPLVIEEFGYPRDGHSFSPHAATEARNVFIGHMMRTFVETPVISGVNFWAWGGEAIARHEMWAQGDPFTGDPPQEPQGLYSVFATDTATLGIIRQTVGLIRDIPADGGAEN